MLADDAGCLGLDKALHQGGMKSPAFFQTGQEQAGLQVRPTKSPWGLVHVQDSQVTHSLLAKLCASVRGEGVVRPLEKVEKGVRFGLGNAWQSRGAHPLKSVSFSS